MDNRGQFGVSWQPFRSNFQTTVPANNSSVPIGNNGYYGQPYASMNPPPVQAPYVNTTGASNPQMQNSLPSGYLRGRVVQNPNEIAPSETSMDTIESYFPLQDRSAIIVKRWNNNGLLEEDHYILDKQSVPASNVKSVSTEEFGKFVDLIDRKLAGILDEIDDIKQNRIYSSQTSSRPLRRRTAQEDDGNV